jgi:hypothetical protein
MGRAVRPGLYVKSALMDANGGIGRDNVEAVWLQPYPIGYLGDLHRRGAGQQFSQSAGVPGVQVLNEDESEAGITGQVLENLGECLQAAGGSAESGYGTRGIGALAGFLAGGSRRLFPLNRSCCRLFLRLLF